MKTFYQLLEITPSASPGEVRQGFRAQIARYHPDKVQHLGQEFQDLAAQRAAELTEAYRILSDEERRAAYDRGLAAQNPSSGAAVAPSRGSAPNAAARPGTASENRSAGGERFARERVLRDQVVRTATVNRFDQALAAAGDGYRRTDARGFDFAWLPKSRLFGRRKRPRLAGRVVARVDGDSIAAAFADAGKWSTADEVCVFLMGGDMAAAGELACAIALQRRRPAAVRVTVVPVDARTWEAHLPAGTPPIAKRLLDRVRKGT